MSKKSETLRFTIPSNGLLDLKVTSSPIQFKLISGKDAEIHGFPLEHYKNYTMNEGGIGIHTWCGCQIEISGIMDIKPRLLYSNANNNENDDNKEEDINAHATHNSPYKQFLAIHSFLNKQRQELSKKTNECKIENIDKQSIYEWTDFEIHRKFMQNLDSIGPRILILGKPDCGKSTLCKSLINYSKRMDNETIFIDIDCGQNSVSIPGTMAGDVIQSYLIPWNKTYETNNNNNSNSNNQINKNPFLYYFGNTSPTHFEDLYKHWISVLSIQMKKKFLCLNESRVGGAIINTCGFVEGPIAKSIIKHIIHSFAVNSIVIMDRNSDKSNDNNKSDCKDDLVEFIENIKSENKEIYEITSCHLSSCVATQTRNANERYQTRQKMCETYFHEFSSFQRSYSFYEFVVYRIDPYLETSNDNINNNGSSSDIDYKSKNQKKAKHHKKHRKSEVIKCLHYYVNGSCESVKFQVSTIAFRSSMIGNIIAVTHAQNSNELMNSSIAGYLFIKDIDFEKKEVLVLQTCVGKFPGLLLFGNVKWDGIHHKQ